MFYFLLRALFSVIFYSYDNVSSLFGTLHRDYLEDCSPAWGLSTLQACPVHMLYLFSLSPLHRPSHLVSMGQPSSSYLSQADVSENRDLQVWLLGNGSSAPLLIGNLQSRECMVKVSNTSPSQVLRSANLPWQSGRQ